MVTSDFDTRLLTSDILRPLFPRRWSELLPRINRTQPSRSRGEPNPLDTSLIAAEAMRFLLQSGVANDSIRDAARELEGGAAYVRLVHQPNTFCYQALLAQFFLLHETAQRLAAEIGHPVVSVYVVQDIDICGEKRYRVAHFPDVERREGRFSYHPASIKKESRRRLAAFVDPPTSGEIVALFEHIQTIMQRDRAYLRRRVPWTATNQSYSDRIDILRKLALDAWNDAASLSEFNARYLARVVINHFKLPVLFVPYSTLLRHMKDHAVFVTAALKGARRDVGKGDTALLRGVLGPSAPDSYQDFWLVCGQCHERRAVPDNDPCRREDCRFAHRPPLDSSLCLGVDAIPRILADDLLDLVAFRPLTGVSYYSGIDHLARSRLLARTLGWEVFPELVWYPNACHEGVVSTRIALEREEGMNPMLSAISQEVQREIDLHRFSSLYYMVEFEAAELHGRWAEYFSSDGELHKTITNVKFTA